MRPFLENLYSMADCNVLLKNVATIVENCYHEQVNLVFHDVELGNIFHMSDRTQCFLAELCPNHHTASTNFLFSYNASWCHHFPRIPTQTSCYSPYSRELAWLFALTQGPVPMHRHTRCYWQWTLVSMCILIHSYTASYATRIDVHCVVPYSFLHLDWRDFSICTRVALLFYCTWRERLIK